MTTQSVVMTAAGLSDAIILPKDSDTWRQMVASLLVNFASGTVGVCNVQVTNDATAEKTPTSARWNLHDTLQSLGASKNGNLGAPVLAIRLQVLSLAAGGQIALDFNIPNPGKH